MRGKGIRWQARSGFLPQARSALRDYRGLLARTMAGAFGRTGFRARLKKMSASTFRVYLCRAICSMVNGGRRTIIFLIFLLRK